MGSEHKTVSMSMSSVCKKLSVCFKESKYTRPKNSLKLKFDFRLKQEQDFKTQEEIRNFQGVKVV